MIEGFKLLLITSKRLGDTIFATPAIATLRRMWPEIQIDCVATSALSAEALAFNPAVRKVYRAEEKPLSRIFSRYDQVLGLHDGGAPRRYAGAFPVEFIHSTPNLPMAEQIQGFFARRFVYPVPIPGPYRLYPQLEHRERIRRLLDRAGVGEEQRLLGLHLGTQRLAKRRRGLLRDQFRRLRPSRVPAKQWPESHALEFVEAARRRHPSHALVLTGSPGERDLGREFAGRSDVIDLIGETGVLDLAALMSRLDAFVSSDTGPLHVACAMDLPLVGLYGQTPSACYGPFPRARHQVVIDDSCMDEISAERVLEALTPLLEASPTQSHISTPRAATATP